eukprot:199769_1
MGNCNPSRCGKNMIEYGQQYTKKRITCADNTEHIPKHLSHLAPMDFKTMELLLQFDTITVSPTSVTNVSFTPVIIPVIDQSNIDPKNTDDIPNGSTQQCTTDSECDYDSNPNLYRAGTSNPWDSDDMANLHNEMSCQLIDLTKQALDVEINRLNTNTIE